MAYKDNSADWLFFAESDLRAAEALLEEAMYHLVCFHAHQTVEKSLKAILRHCQQPIPKTHDIVFLRSQVVAQKIFDQPSENDTVFVSQFYMPTRYPDMLPGMLPDGLPGLKDARRALEIAGEFYAFARQWIESSTREKRA